MVPRQSHCGSASRGSTAMGSVFGTRLRGSLVSSLGKAAAGVSPFGRFATGSVMGGGHWPARASDGQRLGGEKPTYQVRGRNFSKKSEISPCT
jgi:hypothetical protein